MRVNWEFDPFENKTKGGKGEYNHTHLVITEENKCVETLATKTSFFNKLNNNAAVYQNFGMNVGTVFLMIIFL